ncbi:cytosolic sulfotransferase 12-like protein [Cinnamomum micranthum f. kanehirae]|uniref:Sulfotransferase n=1 Tax=Cinnamomum micranthum f. kanehirae TaxID=337451 RepID=A0A443N4G6_9MAGN|nr:cytosolic sulfotransferase 12-like protein [Cinnamomum micranthum f. kanehirae]
MATSNIVPELEVPLSIVEKGWKSSHLTQYQGFWLPIEFLSGVMACRERFEACKDDIMLNTTPKSGTTWLKALTFTISNRTRHDFHNHPLLTTNPHALVPNLKLDQYADDKVPDLTNLPSPRLFCSHFPYELLPTSIIESNCRIIYLCRNPKDAFVSLWHFSNNFLPEDEPPVPIEEAFELFHGGISIFGPFWEHLLGYWKASLERPERVLFMKYEELKEDPTFHLKRLAEFLGFPFSIEEERQGLVEKIERFCSFESLMSLEVNKSGKIGVLGKAMPNKNFFRRGIVGDWKNHLTAEMSEKLDQLSQQKLEAFGLTFKDVGK